MFSTSPRWLLRRRPSEGSTPCSGAAPGRAVLVRRLLLQACGSPWTPPPWSRPQPRRPTVESAMREDAPVFVPVANIREPLPPPPAGPAAIIWPLWGMSALPAAAAPAAAAHRDADGEGPGAAARARVPAGLPRDPGEGLLFANGSAAAADPSTSTPSAKGLSLSRVVACDSEDDGLLNECDLSDFDF
ncbi:unnamed protein product [Prorocentrum cordatum]|uniref:Uncharacterized protein n=1 Tax=Prorocentrum cordatum TaxID=2364126 RepID=A0ABN9R4Q8_9DINO|nr:unnamed protein product [Polarella glacialis]